MSSKCPRNFCWTLNNPTEAEITSMKNDHSMFSYIVFGLETGSKGTTHLQGYCECLTQYRFKKVRQFFNNRAHIEPRKGTPKQAAGYCKKGECEEHLKTAFRCIYCQDFEGDWEFFFPRTVEEPETWMDPFEEGTISQQGKRSDITAPVEMLTEGSNLTMVAKTFPEQFVKYHKGFSALRSLLMQPRALDKDPQVIWLWGPTGVGKTRDAYLKYWPKEPHYVWQASNGRWWDGYDGEDKIIMEEFRGQMLWSDLLALLQRTEYRVQYKGGFVHIQASKFVFTSPFPPDKVYKEDNSYDRRAQLLRRITRVVHMETLQELHLPIESYFEE